MKNEKKKVIKRFNSTAPKIKFNLIIVIILFLLLITMTFFYLKYINNLTRKNVYQNITELSEQTASQLNLVIADQKRFVEILVDNINNNLFEKPEDVFEIYRDDLENYHFTRLVILDREGNGTTSDGLVSHNYPGIDEYFAEHEGKGDTVQLSENNMSAFSNTEVNTYSRLFTFKGKEYILYAVVKTENYSELLPRRLFNGQGGTYLINNDGEILIDSYRKVTRVHTNIYDYWKETYNFENENELDKLDIMKNNIKKGINDSFDINLENETYFIHYTKLNINDWYVVTVVPDTVIANELDTFSSTAFFICLGFSLALIGVFTYISINSQKNSQRIYNIAYIDSITSLGNATYFKENGSKFLENLEENKYIISIDINRFKILNNIYGYEFCNKVLKMFGDRLFKMLPKNNITCRMSNDIFASIFSYNGNIKELLNMIFDQASNITIDDTSLFLNLSIGAYRINKDDTDINSIISKSYMARAKIKGLYDNGYYIFDEVLENKLLEEQKIESCMKQALEKGEFQVYYQPKINTETEKIIGAEALVRWHKDGQIIPPNKFIPLFERNKFILKLDIYIFEQACKDIANWKKTYGFSPIISINVSKEHFTNENFIDEYARISDKYDIDRSHIDLEITESATIDENIDILNILNKIKEKGFVISIDDFGTGYSSLSMIQSMPLDILKIDKVFVDKADLTNDENIINYIMLIAKHLEVKTIAEGVETKEQVEFIKRKGGDIIQGYYYSKPLSK